MPDRKQRTPNLAIDNLCLFKNKQGQLCTILGLMDKTVPINGVNTLFKGWVMSGGHMEYHQDLSTEECSRRELLEEFGIKPENIIRTVPCAVFEDLLRDSRNEYISTLYLHWVNQIPKSTDEHKVVLVVTLEELLGMIKSGKPLKVPQAWSPSYKPAEEYGLLNGHDSMIAAALELPATKALMGEIASTF
jgi:ADP-ribose pyrophosphatase YjhB (NUDIX family)